MKEIRINGLQFKVSENRQEMGAIASDDVEQKILEILKAKGRVRMIFASAPSQNDILAELTKKASIDWSKIEAFHMDEYIGLEPGDPRLFSEYIVSTLFRPVGLKNYYLIDPSNHPEEECRRYSALLDEAPIDIVCLGIGENGHLAFNEPEYADFNDSKMVKLVRLDDKCRNQQVHDGCFKELDAVPQIAITLTIPALFQADALFCVVPGPTKKAVLNQLLQSPVVESLPCSILKSHKNCWIYTEQKLEGVN